MRQTRRIAAPAFAVAAALLLSSCGEDVATVETMPPQPPATAVGTASGSGQMERVTWSKDASAPPERSKVDFTAKYSYAFPETVDGQRTLWLVVADQSPDTTVLDGVDDRINALRGWCKTQHANYVALQLDARHKPMAWRICAGDGGDASTRLSEDSTMGDRANVDLAVNDGKRVEGSLVTGVGSTTVGDKESIAEITGDYRISAALAAPTLRDRVLAGGDEKGSGIPGAKAAFLKYWKAAGSAKTFDEMAPWFTPERQAHSAAQAAEMAEMGEMAKRMLEMYAKGHAEAPSITAAKAMGAAAVLTSESNAGNAKLTCQTLLLQLQGAWKVGDERCLRQGKK
jgi:hypothetical protein